MARGRIRHYARNVGPWGVLRTVGAVCLIVGVPVTLLVRTGDWRMLPPVGVGVLVPFLARNILAHRPEVWGMRLHWLAMTIVAVSFSSPLWYSKMTEAAAPWLIVPFMFVVSLYASGMFWMASDPHVIIERPGRR